MVDQLASAMATIAFIAVLLVTALFHSISTAFTSVLQLAGRSHRWRSEGRVYSQDAACIAFYWPRSLLYVPVFRRHLPRQLIKVRLKSNKPVRVMPPVFVEKIWVTIVLCNSACSRIEQS
jgi:hypothetical protein